MHRSSFLSLLLIFLFLPIQSQDHELSVQTGHSLTITDLVFSPDGRFLVSCGDDNHIVVWDVASGRQVRVLEGHTGPVSQVTMHPGGEFLASVSDDHTVCLWNYTSGELVRQIPFDTDYLKAVGFTESGQKLIVAGAEVYAVDLENYTPEELPGIPGELFFDCVAASQDKFAVGGRKGKVYVYDLAGQQVEKRYSLVCSELGLGEDSRYLVGAGLSGKLRRWDLNSGMSKVTKLSIPADNWLDSYHAVALSSDNRYFAGGNRNQKIYIYDIRNARTHLIIAGHDEKVTALSFSPDNRFIASAGKDRVIRLWDMDNGRWIKTMRGFIGAITCISAGNVDGVLALGDNTGYCGIVELWPEGRVYSARLQPKKIQDMLGWRYSVFDVHFNPTVQKMMIEARLIREVKKKNMFTLKSRPAFFIWDLETDELSLIAHDRPGQLISHKGFALFNPKKNEVEKLSFSKEGSILSEKTMVAARLPRKAEVNFSRMDETMELCLYGYRMGESEHWVLTETGEGTVMMEGELGHPLKEAAIAARHLVLKTHSDSVYLYYVKDKKLLAGLVSVGPVKNDGNVLYFSKGNELVRFDPETGRMDNFSTNHSGAITSFSQVAGRDLLVTGGVDGSLRFRGTGKATEEFSLVTVPPRDRILISPDNYYMATKGALRGVGFTVGPEVYSFEQFDLMYNRPDRVLANTGMADSTLINNYRLAYEKRLKKLGKTEKKLKFQAGIPELEISYEPEILSTRSKTIRFVISARARENNLERLHVLVNGVPEYGKSGEELDASSSRYFEKEVTLDMNPGLNDIQVYISDQTGASSMRRNFQVNYNVKEEKPDLYLVAIGTSKFEQSLYNLTYAAKDAEDVTNALNSSDAFEEVHRIQIKDEEVTLERIRELNSFISDADVNDVVIIFIAGHGVLNHELDYYLSTYDIDFTMPEGRGIPYDELEDILGQTKSRKKVLFLDACHSGELDKEEVELAYTTQTEAGDITFRNVGRSVQSRVGMALQSSFELSRILFADMRNSNGATVVSSAGGAEYAMEGQQWNNGVFTYCILNGITEEKADLNGDGRIMLSELQEYINNEVPRLTDGKQTPTSRVENLSNDFRIW